MLNIRFRTKIYSLKHSILLLLLHEISSIRLNQMVNSSVTHNQKGRENFLHESDQSIHLMTTLINVDDDLKVNNKIN
jgi:hypothetical protein